MKNKLKFFQAPAIMVIVILFAFTGISFCQVDPLAPPPDPAPSQPVSPPSNTSSSSSSSANHSVSGISSPSASTVWQHGDTGITVEWSGLSGEYSKVNLFNGDDLITVISGEGWLEGKSSLTFYSPVSSDWGSGGDYRVQVVNAEGGELWSVPFRIMSDCMILSPSRYTCWSTGTTPVTISWTGLQGETAKCELYQNGNKVADITGWITNSGEYNSSSPLPSSWGTGEGFIVKVSDEFGNIATSGEFDIGAINTSLEGSSEITWSGGGPVIILELYNGAIHIDRVSPPLDNTGSYSPQISDLPDGDLSNLRIKVTDNQNQFGWVELPSPGEVFSGPVINMTFAYIPSGSFMMGSPGSEDGRYDREGPLYSVSISSFELMTTEVTQGMWEAVMAESASSHHEMSKGAGDNYPMYYVSWNDCQEFIDKLNELDSSYTYRLPSESEWEYACRAGTTTRFYWGDSDSGSVMGDYCWYSSNSSSSTHPVATKLPNAWGLYDMSGNVYEWCEDTWHGSYEEAPTDGSVWVTPGASSRVGRGGSWGNSARFCRSAYRINDSAVSRFYYLGFRLARSVR